MIRLLLTFITWMVSVVFFVFSLYERETIELSVLLFWLIMTLTSSVILYCQCQPKKQNNEKKKNKNSNTSKL